MQTWIAGRPVPKGSMKCVGNRGSRRHVLIDSNRGISAWQRKLTDRLAGCEQFAAGEPLCVDARFYVPRPQSHYGRGSRQARVRSAVAGLWPVKRSAGDLDKLIRAVCDAAQSAGVFPDDAAIVTVTASKQYAVEVPGVLISITRYGESIDVCEAR